MEEVVEKDKKWLPGKVKNLRLEAAVDSMYALPLLVRHSSSGSPT